MGGEVGGGAARAARVHEQRADPVPLSGNPFDAERERVAVGLS
jgi:hypothetical protein